MPRICLKNLGFNVIIEPIYTKQFEKDKKLSQKRGKDFEKLKYIIELLLASRPLPVKYRDHWLSGEYLNRRECHIEPDWLLIYKPIKQENCIIFERLGTHSDLFR